METGMDAGCAPAGGGSAGLLAEFRTWLDRERGLSPVTVGCYGKQARTFLVHLSEPLDAALRELDAGQIALVPPGAPQLLQMLRVVSPKSNLLFALVKQARQRGSPRARTQHCYLQSRESGVEEILALSLWAFRARRFSLRRSDFLCP